MRALSFFLFATLASCGGSTASIPSASNDPAAGGEASAAAPVPAVAPPPAAVAPPSASTCGASGAPTVFASASQQRAAIGAAWDACENPICPATEPHLFFSRDGSYAACGQWCGGDGGFCGSNDPQLVFDYAVSSGPDGFVLDLANQKGSDPRSFTIRFWTASPVCSMELTDNGSSAVTRLETVGIPVK